jgi:hypothetical protein
MGGKSCVLFWEKGFLPGRISKKPKGVSTPSQELSGDS